MSTTTLLIEILTQELPAIPFLKEFPNIKSKWRESLKHYYIHDDEEVSIFYTPRRIVIFSPNFPLKSKERVIESFGPPVSIAYQNGALSKAGTAFCAKNGIEADSKDLQRVSKDGKEVLYYKQSIAGVDCADLLQEVFSTFMKSLHFGKSMRWGNLSEEFIRPVQNICAFLGDRALDLEVFGIKSTPQTFGHRDIDTKPIKLKDIPTYFETLKRHKVILDQEERRAIILSQIKSIESAHNVMVELDCELLSEVVAITEYPTCILGKFEEQFLSLPSEVIITSMKENQRYFAIYKENTLYNGFIVVCNSTSSDTSLIVAGNEKVLRARLCDAAFFYENDLKKGLDSTHLRDILFVQGLGTLADKIVREEIIAKFLCQKYAKHFTSDEFVGKNDKDIQSLLLESINLAKADLLSEMVGEFPELQGIMGGYYARALGKDERIVRAIQEQYLPNGEDDDLPSNLLSAIVSLSNKIDSILALFSIKKIPSGSKDPYAIRRAANGIIKIVQKFNLHFDIHTDLTQIYEQVGYAKGDMQAIQSFFLERLESTLKVNPSIFSAVIAGLNSAFESQRDIVHIRQNTLCLNQVLEQDSDKATLLSTFKRVANICKQSGISDVKNIHITPSLFTSTHEQVLYDEICKIKQRFADLHNATDFVQDCVIVEFIQALFGLKQSLSQFFDNVLVNDKDIAIKQNRENLILCIYAEFLRVGDMSKISL